jgi:hypothetical protein
MAHLPRVDQPLRPEPFRPDEHLLTGRWIMADGRIEADETAQRIEALTADVLSWLADSSDGWSSLHLDGRDGRIWELTYAQSEMHGGGPPSLAEVTRADAANRYRVTFPNPD